MRNRTLDVTVLVKSLLHLSCTFLLVYNFYLAITGDLGGDPVEGLLHVSGMTAFNLTLICLFISPMSRWLKYPRLMKTRRMIGLWAFTFALAHLLTFILFELQLDWSLLVSEIIERPYITVGFAAFVILLLLAATSTTSAQRKLGPTWQKLHNWIYLAVLLIALHFIWSVKSELYEPAIYWAIALFLLGVRYKKLLRPWRKA